MNDSDLSDFHQGMLTAYEQEFRNSGLSAEEAKLRARLKWIVFRGSLSQLEEILATGIKPTVEKDPRNETLLGMVIHWRNEKEGPDFFRRLVQAGADPSAVSGNKTLMSAAWRHGNTQWAIPILLELIPKEKLVKADLNKALLASAGNPSLVKQALLLGAEVNHRDVVWNACLPSTPLSALMLASFWGIKASIQLLIEAGADVNLKDGEGHTALDYALPIPSTARKVVPLLEKAGAISGKPFPRPRSERVTRGFAAAARQPAYKEALARIRELTGVKPQPLEAVDGKIPGGYGFLMEEFRARAFVKEHQQTFLTGGSYLFFTEDLTQKNGSAVAIVPTTDIYRVIAAVETEGPNDNIYNEDLINGLRNLEKEQPFTIAGIGSDFIEGTFTPPIKDPVALVKRLHKLCPDDDAGPEVEQRRVQDLAATNKLFLWWP